MIVCFVCIVYELRGSRLSEKKPMECRATDCDGGFSFKKKTAMEVFRELPDSQPRVPHLPPAPARVLSQPPFGPHPRVVVKVAFNFQGTCFTSLLMVAWHPLIPQVTIHFAFDTSRPRTPTIPQHFTPPTAYSTDIQNLLRLPPVP